MHRSAVQHLVAAHFTFNSLFEMLPISPEFAMPQEVEAFNSLFEMRL